MNLANILLYTLTISIILSIVLYVTGIPYLYKLKFGQFIREEGPVRHQVKSGTPTMGGIIFIFSTLISVFLTMLIINRTSDLDIVFPHLLFLMLPFVLYGVLGFIDDYLIVIKRSNRGLSARVKFLSQIFLAVLFFLIYLHFGFKTLLTIGSFQIDLQGFYGVLIMLMFVSSSNAVNLTDGLDGLAGGLVLIALMAFGIIAHYQNFHKELVFIVALAGSLIGFLFFNYYPAKIFMGDTGSLALGASIASIAIFISQEYLLLVIGFVFLVETLSVILQVAYFKKTKGKRLFKMTPLHHHFELCGWSEKKTVLSFYFVGLIVALIGIWLGLSL